MNSKQPLKNGPYRFFFYASDGNEPHHVHVERIEENEGLLMEAWNEYFEC